jgi:hypothetical protein
MRFSEPSYSTISKHSKRFRKMPLQLKERRKSWKTRIMQISSRSGRRRKNARRN